jgi:hypothetical protein
MDVGNLIAVLALGFVAGVIGRALVPDGAIVAQLVWRHREAVGSRLGRMHLIPNGKPNMPAILTVCEHLRQGRWCMSGDRRPSDTHLYPMRERLDGDSPVRVVGEAELELGVELGLVVRLRLGEDVDGVAQGFDQCSGLRLGELAAGHDAAELCPGGASLSFDLGDPLRDRGDRLAFVQERSIALEPPVTGPDLSP